MPYRFLRQILVTTLFLLLTAGQAIAANDSGGETEDIIGDIDRREQQKSERERFEEEIIVKHEGQRERKRIREERDKEMNESIYNEIFDNLQFVPLKKDKSDERAEDEKPNETKENEPNLNLGSYSHPKL